MTILSVRHVTTYRYSRPVAFGEHRMMFRPRDSYDQKLHRGRGRDHARAGAFPLDPRRVRELRRDRELRRAGARAALREPDAARPRAGASPRLPDRGIRQDLSVLVRGGRAAGSPALDRAALSRSRAAARALGAQVPAPGAPDRDRRASEDPHLRHQGGLRLRAALGGRHARAADDAEPSAAAAAAISRS